MLSTTQQSLQDHSTNERGLIYQVQGTINEEKLLGWVKMSWNYMYLKFVSFTLIILAHVRYNKLQLNLIGFMTELLWITSLFASNSRSKHSRDISQVSYSARSKQHRQRDENRTKSIKHLCYVDVKNVEPRTIRRHLRIKDTADLPGDTARAEGQKVKYTRVSSKIHPMTEHAFYTRVRQHGVCERDPWGAWRERLLSVNRSLYQRYNIPRDELFNAV